jgi:hypothetical protein
MSLAPLLLLLATDIANGCVALVTGEPATAAALVVKAGVAAWLAVQVRWSGTLVLAVLLPLVCGLAYLGLRPDALRASQLESNLLLAKTAGSTWLLALAAAHVRELSPQDLARYLRTVLCVIALSLALGVAGIGHDRYGDDEAFLSANGFMPAGNELNIALLALFWWLSDRKAAGLASSLDRALYWLCLALMVVSGSKTTIVGAALCALWFQRRHPMRMLAALVVAVIAWRVMLATGALDRWLFFFGVHLEQGLLSALTGGRFGRAADALDALHLLPPQGSAFMATNGYVESDPLDLLLNFGWAGIGLAVAFAGVLWKAAGGRMLPWLLVLAGSTLAGHVTYSVFAAPVLAAALCPPRFWRAVPVSGALTKESGAHLGPDGSSQVAGETVVQPEGTLGIAVQR